MKAIPFLFLLFFMAFWQDVSGQKKLNRVRKGKNNSYGYFLMEPVGNPKGILLLLPGLGERPEEVFRKTNLPGAVAEYGFITIVPALGKRLFADGEVCARLTNMLESCMAQYDLTEPPVIIGGFSRGGAIALRYVEALIASESSLMVKGVFAIDPALDLSRLYQSSLRKINASCSEAIKNEGIFTREYLEEALGGPPGANRKEYIEHSVYSPVASDGGNARFLKKIPVRLYSEPDLDYVQRVFCKELKKEDINATDLERLHGFLKRNGNKLSEYITTTGRGFHSWNILEVQDCLDWVLRISGQ